MNTMQKRLLERIERDVEAVKGRRLVAGEKLDRAWMTFDTTVASNVGLIQVGRESDVGPRRQVRADFQAERARFSTTGRSPEAAGWDGSAGNGAVFLAIRYSDSPAEQAEKYARLLDYLTAPLRSTAAVA